MSFKSLGPVGKKEHTHTDNKIDLGQGKMCKSKAHQLTHPSNKKKELEGREEHGDGCLREETMKSQTQPLGTGLINNNRIDLEE